MVRVQWELGRRLSCRRSDVSMAFRFPFGFGMALPSNMSQRASGQAAVILYEFILIIPHFFVTVNLPVSSVRGGLPLWE